MIFLLGLFVSFSFAQTQVLRQISVTHEGDPTNLNDYVPSVTTLKNEELQKRRQTTIGDTLSTEAGVSSTSFGPNSSRPVIRGLDGARIRILQNSLTTLDASTQSLDHNIPIDPMLVDSIEIVRGPMSLLYGSGAVGGVVNIVTDRTHHVYEEGLFTQLQTQYETVNNGISTGGRIDYGVNNWVLHFDGGHRNIGETEIPGYARTEKARETPPDEGDEAFGIIPNSQSEQNTLGVGATKFFSKGHMGLSFSHFNSEYGSVVEDEVTIDMIQNRFELHGEYEMTGIFNKLTLRSAYSDYQHKEIEDGATGTIFTNTGNETRLEVQNKNGKFKGVSGIQTQFFDFEAQGDEAFLPETDNLTLAAFTYQDLALGKDSLLFGARVEQTEIEKASSDNFGASDDFSFTGVNGSLGYRLSLSENSSASLSYAYTERAPTFQELLSNGEHVATGTFEVGDSGLSKEKSHGLELGYKKKNETSEITAGAYVQQFENYISLNPRGTQNSDGVDEYDYEEDRALLYGFDVDASQRILKTERGVLTLNERLDYLRGRNLSQDDDLPRITPFRVTLAPEYQVGRFTHDFEVQYWAAQTNVADNERRTPDYWILNLGTRYSLITDVQRIDVFFRVRNLLDDEIRNHVSFLKERVPLPGRNFIVGVQWML